MKPLAAYIIFTLFLSMLWGLTLNAQNPNLVWAKKMGGGLDDNGHSITVDGTGNVFTTGVFWGTADFDPGPGVFNLTSYGQSDIFVSKLNAAGNFVWAKQMGGTGQEGTASVAVDNNGDVYIIGWFVGTADFDPGPGTFNLTSFGGEDIFVSKLDAAGNFIWAKQFGGPETGGDEGMSVAVDNSGNVYTTGRFWGIADFDPGPGIYNLIANTILFPDIFVSKLDVNGNFVWAKQMGGGSDDDGYSIALDGNGNVYTTGYFQNTADFDPGPGTYNLISYGQNDIYISKLDASGSFIWAKQMGGINQEYSQSIAVDASGNVYTTGIFIGTADFDPGPGIYNLTSAGDFDIFVSKLDILGNFIWAKRIGGATYDYGFSIDINANGNVYTIGNFEGTADFDPGPGTYNLTSTGWEDVFVSSLDASGNFIWAIQLGGAVSDWGYSIAVDGSGFLYTTGIFWGTADFDPCPGTYNLISAGNHDIFVAKLSLPLVTISASSTTICPNTSVTFTATPTNGGATPVYQWQVNGINVGTNSSTFTTNTLANGDVVTVNMTSDAACPLPTTVTSNAITITVFPALPASVNITASASNICAGTSVTFTATPTNGGTTPAYQWQVNGGNVGTNSATYTTAALANGDVVRVIMTSNATCASPTTATSNAITMTVTATVTPSVGIAASSTTICAGTSVTFTATPTNGGTTPAYQWQVNGGNVGTNSPTYTTTTLANGDIVRVIMTSNLACASPTIATSNTITMTVNPTVIPSVNITASSTTICIGTNVTFTATPTNGGATPAYQWQVNGINAGTNSPTFASATVGNGDIVRVIITSNAICVSPTTATSNIITITVNPTLAPSVNIAVNSTTICSNTSVTFNATPTNGGTSPVYQWQVNGVNVGTNSSSYTTNSLSNGDVVTAIMSSNVTCATVNVVTSNTITMTVINTTVTPSVSIASSPGNICFGTIVTFTASPTNGGNSPAFQWKLNSSNTGTNSPTFISNTLANGDIINCLMTSNAICAVPNTVPSNNITVVIDPAVCPMGFYMPTAFTPNKDGKNDVCKPTLIGNVLSYKFSVYNRWGQKIFETTDLQKGWDGKVSGFDTDANVFIWVCVFQFTGQALENRKGTVVLIH